MSRSLGREKQRNQRTAHLQTPGQRLTLRRPQSAETQPFLCSSQISHLVLYHAADSVQLLQHKVHLLLRGQGGQNGAVAPAGQLGVVVGVVGSDELQAGVSYQVPALPTHVLCVGRCKQ